mmetsp:Transcript_52982/g.60231  ORF Transcript_52982/g.60231 Transcript_52982/m.60231 type:complete len:103 (+) Transcript_52982:514-822(+)
MNISTAYRSSNSIITITRQIASRRQEATASTLYTMATRSNTIFPEDISTTCTTTNILTRNSFQRNQIWDEVTAIEQIPRDKEVLQRSLRKLEFLKEILKPGL